jgi:hypothetical protein
MSINFYIKGKQMITCRQFYNILNTVRIGVIARQTKISRQALHKLKKSETRPSFKTIEEFSKHYEAWMPLYEFIEAEKESNLGLEEMIYIWKSMGTMLNMKPSNVCYHKERESEKVKQADSLYFYALEELGI